MLGWPWVPAAPPAELPGRVGCTCSCSSCSSPAHAVLPVGCCACGQPGCLLLPDPAPLGAPGAGPRGEGRAGFLPHVHGINVLFCAQGLRHHVLVTHCRIAQLHQVRRAHLGRPGCSCGSGGTAKKGLGGAGLGGALGRCSWL